MRSGRLVTVAVLLALGVLAANASSAGATITLSSFSNTPSTTLAGGHPNDTLSSSFSYSNTTDDLKSLTVYLPPGLVGNPSVVPQCTTTQLSSDSCPAGSKIGTTSVTARAVGLPVPTTAPGDVYNVKPTGSEPARIGMVVRPLDGLLGKFSLSGPAEIRIPGDFGLTTTFDNLPRTLPPLLGLLPIPVTIDAISLTLNGLVNNGTAAFLTNPTSCGPANTLAVAGSYEGSSSARLTGFTPTDCPHVPFNPGISFSFDSPRASTPSGMTVAVTFPPNELPRHQSHLRTNVVVLPGGTALNPGLFAGLVPCTDAQLNTASAAAATCPAASQIGDVTFSTPVLGDLPGQVYFGASTPTQPLRQFIQVNIKGKYAKFIAVNALLSGTIWTVLDNLPQVPFTRFALTFRGGPNAVVLTPPCGTHNGFGAFTPWSGNPNVVVGSPVTITQTSTGAPCP